MSGKLLVVGQLPPPVHGSNIMTERFVRSLQNIGHDVFLVPKTFSRRQEEVEKFSIIKIFKIPIIAIKLIQRIAINRPNLCFYFISVKLPSFFVDVFYLFLIKLFRIDCVLYFHGKGLLELGTESGFFVKYLVNKTLSSSLGGLVLAEALKGDVNKFISDNRLFVLPNAIPDIDLIKLSSDHNNQEPIQILFLSNLIPSKGPMEFVRMAKKVVEKVKGVKFVLAGPVISKEFFEKIENYIKKERLIDFIEIPGSLYGAEKEKYFRKSDIFVFPTYYELEASPLVNLEAMQWGLPVISTYEGAIPEVIRDGINGFIVNPKDISKLADKVLHLISDQNLRKQMGEASRKSYENCYTIQAYEKRLKKAVDFFFELKK